MNNEKYWKEQIAKKEAEIKELQLKVEEGAYYRGLYIGTREATSVVPVDDTFEDILTEK